MRWLLAALSAGFAAAAFAVAASGREEPPARVPNGKPTRSQLERGKTTFARLGCAGCHNLSGSDAGAQHAPGPNLDFAIEGKTREQLRRDITDPLAEPEGQMGEFGTMPTDFAQRMKPGELEALISYLLSRQDGQ